MKYGPIFITLYTLVTLAVSQNTTCYTQNSGDDLLSFYTCVSQCPTVNSCYSPITRIQNFQTYFVGNNAFDINTNSNAVVPLFTGSTLRGTSIIYDGSIIPQEFQSVVYIYGDVTHETVIEMVNGFYSWGNYA